MNQSGSSALVIVPTYNEVDNIPIVVERLFRVAGKSTELLVVDDSSPDRTSEEVKRLQRERAGIHLMTRPGRFGLASAYIRGFRWALERGYDAMVEMDADLSHDPADVPRLLEALDDCGLAIGSRYVEGGRIENWGGLRRALSKGGNVYARAWLGFGVRDSTSGFRAYRAEAVGSVDLSTIRSEGYGFQIEMVRRLHHAGVAIKEIPITFADRTAGRSKMSRTIVFEALGLVTAWGIRDRLRMMRRKKR